MRKIRSHSEQETLAYAEKFGGKLKSGCIIALEGSLGSGKTIFTKGLARGLGITRMVQSPTYILMNVYPIHRRKIRSLVHVDCYRLDDAQEIKMIGLEDYFRDPGAVVIIEWADKMRKLLPRKTITVRLKYAGVHEREITILK